MDYIGLKCGICGESFVENDDVVVCPDCGTPMHRACFKELKMCPNTSKHAEGFVFDGFEKIKRSAQGVRNKNEAVKLTLEKDSESETETYVPGKSCPICGSRNRQGANFCDNCGTRLTQATEETSESPFGADYSDPRFFASYALGQSSDVAASTEIAEDVTAGDVACYVAVNASYYLNAFQRIKEGSRRFNFSAAVFSGVWFLYRKLYKVGALMLSFQALLYALRLYFSQNVSLQVMNKLLATLGLTVKNISSLTMEQYIQLSAEMQKLPPNEQLIMMMPTIVLILQIAVMIVSGVIANKLYYKSCIEKIKELKTEAVELSLSRSETSQSLYLAGGVNAMLAAVFGFIYLFLFFM